MLTWLADKLWTPLCQYTRDHKELFVVSVVTGALITAGVIGSLYMTCEAVRVPEAMRGGLMAYAKLPGIESALNRYQDETRMSIRNIEVTNARMDASLSRMVSLQDRMLDIMLGTVRNGGGRGVFAATNREDHATP